MLQIDRLVAARPYYISFVISGGMSAGNPSDVPPIGARAVVVASSNQPDELLYAVIKTVFDNFAIFRQLHPALSTLDEDMAPHEAIPIVMTGLMWSDHDYRASSAHWCNRLEKIEIVFGLIVPVHLARARVHRRRGTSVVRLMLIILGRVVISRGFCLR